MLDTADGPLRAAPGRRRTSRALTAISAGVLALAFVAATAGPATAAAPTAGPATAAAPTAATADPVGGPRLTGTGVVVAPTSRTVPAPPNVAVAFVVADADSGAVLAAKAPHVRMRPASTQKTLTSITLMPRLDPSSVYTATHDDAAADGAHVGVVEKGTYTVDQLFHGLLLGSGNDTASALANAYGGWPKTLQAMGEEARRLKALDTSVKNPSGLDAPGQLSSAYDMALFARQALRTPQFVSTAGTTVFDFPGAMPRAGQKRATYKVYTQNRLLLHGYPGTIAGKTGYTTLARRTFWAAAKQGDRTLLVTMFNIYAGTEPSAKALLTWGFRYAGRLAPVGQLVEPDPEPASVVPQPAAGATAPAGVVAAGAAGTTTPASGESGSPLRWLLVLVGLAAVAFGVVRWRAMARERERASARAHARRVEYFS